MDIDNKMIYIDEDGTEKEMTVLFTFDAPDKQKMYVLFQDPNDDESQVFAMEYDDAGNLSPIETDDEWEMVEEMLEMFEEGSLEGQGNEEENKA